MSCSPYISCALFIFFLASCSKSEDYPVEPRIELIGWNKVKTDQGKDSIIRININFTDGDGDIGLSPEDTASPFRLSDRFFYTLFVDIYSIENGQAEKMLIPGLDPLSYFRDTVHFHQRLPNITPEGKNKNIKGDLEVSTSFFVMKINGLQPDSVFYRITLYDRQLHASNTLQTEIIPLAF